MKKKARKPAAKAKLKPKAKPKAKAKPKPKARPKAKKIDEEDVLKLIHARKNGILQNELWKKLKIDSRACSRFIASLEARGLVKREWETFEGIRTYRIVAVKRTAEKAKPAMADHHLLMIRDIVAPCAGCKAECDPELCQDLAAWVKLLY